MSARVLGLVATVALTLALAGAAGASEPAGVALLYVESNVGGASGGHAALRVDDLVYNFQFETEGENAGLLVLAREPWERVRFRYATLENRPLHLARLRLDAAETARVRDHFDAFHLEQQRSLDALRVAERDVAHLEALTGRADGLALRGAGLLDPARAGGPDAAQQRARLVARLGPGWLRAARERTARALAALGSDPARLERARELHTEAFALRALDEGHGLAPQAVLVDPSGEPLGAGERAALETFAARLDARLPELLASARPDRGFAVMLASARRLAVARSLREGRLVLLDALPESPAKLSASDMAGRTDEVAAAVAWADRAWRESRARLLAGPLDELRYNALEEGAARTRDLHAAAAGGALRLAHGRAVPARTRRIAVERRDRLDPALASARERRDVLRAELGVRYSYQLVLDNCVHAVSDGLAEALGGPEALAAALGVRGDPARDLGFIPGVYFARAAAGLDVEGVAPYRERALRVLYARDARLLVYARESNRLTSSAYRHRDADGSFLFFTSDVVWPRPLYGIANLLWAVGDGALGLATAPFDRGQRITRAARGAFFSAPELVFMNIRKGTYDLAGLDAAARRLDASDGP